MMGDVPHAELVLVDGSSYLFRAYHALPPLTTSKGVPTGAMYGVLNMLRKLMVEQKPQYAAVLFDTKAKTFRHEMYKDYKANRPEMPEDLAVQIKPLHETIRALGLPLLAIEGVEADDVIATLARHAKAKNIKVLVSTGDKDLAQIVNEHVTLINTMSGEVLDPKGVEAKFGIKPAQITEYLALVGDTSDNVPGIPKVGPKTAVKWLHAYGSLDNVVKSANEITGKIGENLRSNLAQLALSHDLVKVKSDVPLPIDFDQLVPGQPDAEKLLDLFSEYEFKTWFKELESKAPRNSAVKGISVSAERAEYDLILTEAALNRWIDAIKTAKRMAFDTETSSLDPFEANLVGIALGVEAGQSAYIPLGHRYVGVAQQLDSQKVLQKLEPLLNDLSIDLIGQNLKFDFAILREQGIQIERPVYDTMLESYVLNSTATRHDMDSLAQFYLDYKPIAYEEVVGKGAKQINFSDVEIEKALNYSAEDADVTLRLHEHLWPLLNNEPKLKTLYQTIEVPLMSVLGSMEEVGVKIDPNLLHAQSEEISKTIQHLEEQVYILAGVDFNLGSPKQLQEVLYERLKLPILAKTPTGQPSTAENVLQDLSHDFELPRLILEYRSLSKLKSTYTDKLPQQIHPKTGRIHTSYHQAVTATGRLSSTDPNLQNIPARTEEGRKIRKAFIAESGYQILAADYSQIELRIMAHLSGDSGLLNAFHANQDIHRATASEIFGVSLDAVSSEQRRKAKAINFGLIYGMSAFGLAKQIDSEREIAAEYMDIYFKRYPGVKVYMETTREKASKQGFVETLFGRRLYLPDIRAKQIMKKRAAERAAINAPMQGTAADIIKRAMISLYGWQQSNVGRIRMIMQVHDELVFEVRDDFVDEAKELVANHMACAADLAVPLLVGIGVGENWEAAH
ncbi:MAG: DNA polymerase I [Gammaproteobacteria bacterium]